MRLIEYSVNKFITIISIFLLCLIFGVVSLNKIPIQLVPTVEKPKITVRPLGQVQVRKKLNEKLSLDRKIN